jgi:hypothetical protein
MNLVNIAFVVAEVGLLGWALFSAVRWFATPTGQFEPSIVLATVLLGALEFARRRLSARPAPPPPQPAEPFPLKGIQLKDWLSDPHIGAAIRQASDAGASFAIPFVHETPRKLAEGYTFFVTADGRQCHYFGRPSTGERFVLMVKRPAG